MFGGRERRGKRREISKLSYQSFSQYRLLFSDMAIDVIQLAKGSCCKVVSHAMRSVICYNVCVFVVWTLASFACHACAKKALVLVLGEDNRDLSAAVMSATVLTLIQTGACYLCTDVQLPKSHLNMARLTHTLATLSTNLSMAAMYASSTFAIKLMEPLTSAITQYLYLGTRLSACSLLSLPLVVTGALGFTGSPLSQSGLSIGTGMAFASNVILAFRNMTLKKADLGQTTPVVVKRTLTSCSVCASVCVITCGSVYIVYNSGLLSLRTTQAFGLSLLSAGFHVCYSYVSTALVLSHMSVVSHAVANILKRVAVVLMLYGVGQRRADHSNFLWLAVCVTGLGVYTWDKIQHRLDTASTVKQRPEITSRVPKALSLIAIIFVGLVTYTSTIQDIKNIVVHPKDLSATMTGIFKTGQFMTQHNRSRRHDFTFGAHSHEKPPDVDLEPDLDGYLKPHKQEIQDFLQKRLVNDPAIAGFLSKQLKTPLEVIIEAQRVHFNVIGDVLKNFKVAMVFDIADFENKGDPCITVGEFLFLARINLPVIYYCSTKTCINDTKHEKARQLAANYTADELVILVHGGGNLVGYPYNDVTRFKLLDSFQGYQVVVFPQSIFLTGSKEHINNCKRRYCCNENFTLILRDEESYAMAKEIFNGSTRLLMAPDMAFQIGSVSRFQFPVFDVLWIMRWDEEKPGYTRIPEHPADVRFHVSDWWGWATNAQHVPSSLERAFTVSANGFLYLSRGRVVVSDRLHGHILATLMDLPHTIIDNKYHKLSAYHNTWTKSLHNVQLTDTEQGAMTYILEQLKTFKTDLPPRVPFLNISEYFQKVKFEDKEFRRYV